MARRKRGQPVHGWVCLDKPLGMGSTEAVTRMFGTSLPAQTLVPVPRLAIEPMLFEVEAVGMLD